jgi:SAM-dependent methyltransferase
MQTIVMPPRHPVSESFSIAGYRDVDAADDPSSYFAFLDSFADTFREMTEAGVDLLRLRPGDSVLDVGCGHGACEPLLARRVGGSGRIVGLDASHAMLAEARRRFDHSGLAVEFRHGSALALPFRGRIVRCRSRRSGLAVRGRSTPIALGTHSCHEDRAGASRSPKVISAPRRSTRPMS